MSHTPNIQKQPDKSPKYLLPALLVLAGFTALGLVLVQEGRSSVNEAAEVLTPENLGLKDLMKDTRPTEGGANGVSTTKPTPPYTPARMASSKPAAIQTYTPPAVIEEVKPSYPRIAKLVRVQGPVEINLHVDAQGHPVQANVLTGQRLLRDDALKAAQSWRFKPASVNGHAVPSDFRVRFEFRLS